MLTESVDQCSDADVVVGARTYRKAFGQRHVPQAPGYTGRRAVETSRGP